MLFVAVITVHDFTLPRSIGTIIVTLVGMAIVIFLLLLVFNLVQQMAYFLISIYNQLIIRAVEQTFHTVWGEMRVQNVYFRQRVPLITQEKAETGLLIIGRGYRGSALCDIRKRMVGDR